MSAASVLALTLTVLVVSWCIRFVRQRYSFWARLGIACVPARFPLGNIQHSSHLMVDLYRQLKGKRPFGGIFQFIQPVALITDPAMVRNVTVRDFRHFYDRGGFANGAHDPLSGSLLNGEGKRWSTVRHATVPVFSTAKLKAIHPVLVQLVDRFRVVLNEKLSARGDGAKLELKHWVARLTVEIAGGVLLGIDGNCLTDPDGGLYGQIGRQTFLVPKLWQLFLMTSFRPLAKTIGLRLYSRELCELFRQMASDIIGFRRAHPELRRNDLADRLLKLTEKADSGDGGLSESEFAANMYVFLAASYETTSTLVSNCLYELAQQPDLQERARNCALETRAKYGGLAYESLSDMAYIDQCVNETLRKYPSGINMIRVVTEDYPVPDTEVVLPKGVHVIIPVYAIHHDAEYYPDPERFDPERFSPEACEVRKPYTFLPFGVGPKICIAHRLGMMQLRLIVASLLCSYRFEGCPETPPSQSTAHTVIRMNDGLLVKVWRIE